MLFGAPDTSSSRSHKGSHLSRPTTAHRLVRLCVGVVFKSVVFAALLYLPSRSLWPSAWFVLVLSGVIDLIAGALLAVYAPDIFDERLKPPLQKDQPKHDQYLMVAMMCVLCAWAVYIGWEHNTKVPRASFTLQAFGVACFLIGQAGIYRVFHTNTYAIPIVKFQQQREHKVVSTGPYAIVRHPMYAFTPLVLGGSCLAVGSIRALGFVAAVQLIIAVRILHEEDVLRANLPGYKAYAARVKYRLLPYVW